MRRWIVTGAVVAALAAALVAVLVARAASSKHSAPLRHLAATVDYRPGVAADVFLPVPVSRAPLVVLVPGGGWVSADRRGLRPLADRLAAQGMVAVTAGYRAAGDGARFPVPVQDVECAIGFAVARSRQAGIEPSPVVALGHSAGAQLAVLAALTGTRFAAPCPYPPARIDAVIGLAGPYDILSLPSVAEPLFGVAPGAAPARWREADPVTWVRQRPELPVLLVHGADDTTVSPILTTSFADRLRAAGHRVQVEIVPGADHGSIYRPAVVADRIVRWIATLPAG